MKRRLAVALLLACACPAIAMQDDPSTQPATQPAVSEEEGAAAFERGVEAMNNGDWAVAESNLATAAAARPESTSAWFNLALVRSAQDKHEAAIEALQKVVELEPDDWQARAAQLPALEALDRGEEAQAMADELRQMYADGNIDAERFPRQRYMIGEQQVMAYEYFTLQGPRGVRYVFFLIDDEGMVQHRYSLGSYDFTTEASRAVGEIGPNERVWHLDGYSPDNAHQTFGFFNEPPSYTQTRGFVEQIVTQKADAISGTKRDDDGNVTITIGDPATKPGTQPATQPNQ